MSSPFTASESASVSHFSRMAARSAAKRAAASRNACSICSGVSEGSLPWPILCTTPEESSLMRARERAFSPSAETGMPVRADSSARTIAPNCAL